MSTTTTTTITAPASRNIVPISLSTLPTTDAVPAAPEKLLVTIPDMFVSLMAVTPKINPNYETVRAESEAGIIEQCKLDARSKRGVGKCNFSYFSSIASPDSDAEGLRILCDWGNWVFPFDDMFDNGYLRSDPVAAKSMIAACLSVLDEGNENRKPDTPLIEFHDTIWHRFLKNSPKGLQRRYVTAMRDYLEGAVEHVQDHFEGRIPGLEEYLEKHRKAAGVMPIFALVEYADHLDVPDIVFEDPAIQELQRIGTDVVLIQNDIVSYLKEESEGVNHNIVMVCRNSGLSAQAAFDRVGGLLKDRYHGWYAAQARLPHWGEETDRQVQKYIQGLHRTMLANLNFSFYSERYFRDQRQVVRLNRKIMVQPDSQLGLQGRSSIWTFDNGVMGGLGAFGVGVGLGLAMLLGGKKK